MLYHNRIYLPDHEKHLQKMIGEYPDVNHKPTYQYRKYKNARDLCKERRRAIDIGAHVGLWAMHMVDDFERAECFEPVLEHRQCFLRNVGEGFVLHPFACGDAKGHTDMITENGSSGNTRPVKGNEVEVIRIDDFNFENVDFIKVDCEGYEYPALVGAEETILRCKPVIIAEQKPGHAQRFGFEETQAVKYLQGLGMKLDHEDCGDFVLSW